MTGVNQILENIWQRNRGGREAPQRPASKMKVKGRRTWIRFLTLCARNKGKLRGKRCKQDRTENQYRCKRGKKEGKGVPFFATNHKAKTELRVDRETTVVFDRERKVEETSKQLTGFISEEIGRG